MSTAPQTNIFPQRVDPRKLANQGVDLSGQITPDQCTRLVDAVVKIVAPITVLLAFGRNESGRRVVTGSATAEVAVACQRCLEPIPVALAAELAVVIVWSDDQARSLPKGDDAWIVEENSADIIALVEEELLLALPIVSYHPGDECSITTGFGVDSELDTKQASRKNPFEILGQLKH